MKEKLNIPTLRGTQKERMKKLCERVWIRKDERLRKKGFEKKNLEQVNRNEVNALMRPIESSQM